MNRTSTAAESVTNFGEELMKLLPTSDPTEMMVAMQDRVLESLRVGQESLVGLVSGWAAASSGAVPALPALPFADRLPDPVALLENAFGFGERLLAAQKEFFGALLEAGKPVPKASS